MRKQKTVLLFIGSLIVAAFSGAAVFALAATLIGPPNGTGPNGAWPTIWNSVIPQGAVMSFYLDACPSGWILADGTNGTPDLRGAFIRGMLGGQNSRDPSGNRVKGNFQAEDFAAHSHGYFTTLNNKTSASGSGGNVANDVWNNPQTSLTGGPETRPDNVALLLCQKT